MIFAAIFLGMTNPVVASAPELADPRAADIAAVASFLDRLESGAMPDAETASVRVTHTENFDEASNIADFTAYAIQCDLQTMTHTGRVVLITWACEDESEHNASFHLTNHTVSAIYWGPPPPPPIDINTRIKNSGR